MIARRAIRPAMSLAAACAAALAGLGADCNPSSLSKEVSVYALTNPPPGRSADVTEEEPTYHQVRAVTVTRGVALALHCWDSCDYTCTEPTLVSADPTIARVLPLLRQGASAGEFVVVGVAPGQTTLTVHSKCADKVYPLAVVTE